MRISTAQDGPLTVVRLTGRLDGESARHLSGTLEDLLRDGSRSIMLDMSAVDYLSSAGTRELAQRADDLATLRGSLVVVFPSDVVREALASAGLSDQLLRDENPNRRTTPSGRFTQWGLPAIEAQSGTYEVSHYSETGVDCTLHGRGEVLERPVTAADCRTVSFPMGSFGLGVGAIGSTYEEAAPRFGELIAAEGIVAYLPTDGARTPDFMLSYADRAPTAVMASGITWTGMYTDLIRFSTQPGADAIPLAELAEVCTEMCGADAVVLTAVAEVKGLVGASLRQSPAEAAGEHELRHRMSLTPEPAHQGSTAVILGLVARNPTEPLAGHLRPVGEGPSVLGHLHAAVFPFSPVPQRTVMLPALVGRLFQTLTLRNILHLLHDDRGAAGSGYSSLVRGVCWTAPVRAVEVG